VSAFAEYTTTFPDPPVAAYVSPFGFSDTDHAAYISNSVLAPTGESGYREEERNKDSHGSAPSAARA
jgi:hypothetical protein